MKILGAIVLYFTLIGCSTGQVPSEAFTKGKENSNQLKNGSLSKEKSVVVVTERVFNYAPNSAELNSSDREELLKIAKQFINHPKKYRLIEIIGHSDQTGSEDIKVDISKERALAVLEMMKEAGVDRKKIRTSWLAGTEPVDNAKDSSINRRVEIRLFENKN